MVIDVAMGTWVKSSYSQQGGNCVEWMPSHASAIGVVPVRDSKRVGGPVLLVSTGAFAGLVAYAKQFHVRRVLSSAFRKESRNESGRNW